MLSDCFFVLGEALSGCEWGGVDVVVVELSVSGLTVGVPFVVVVVLESWFAFEGAVV